MSGNNHIASPEADDEAAARFRRLRWRTRRGLLENDILLNRLLDSRASQGFLESELQALDQLLDLTDTLDQVALDKYAYTRDVYLALRAKQTGNTDPAAADGELSDPALSASPDAGAGDDLTDPELENGADNSNGSAKQPENAATAASETASPATDAE